MASLNLFVAPIVVTPHQRRVVRRAATSAKSSSGGSSSEEKGILDFVLGKITKQDQFYETDPILKKVEGKPTTGTTGRSKTTVVVPPPAKKEGGFGGLGGLGGLFAKK